MFYCKIEPVRPDEFWAVPEKAHSFDAGYDLRASVNGLNFLLHAGETRAVPLNFRLEIPEGWEGQIRPRSGLAKKHAITVTNSPGTVDAGYVGEAMVLLTNLGSKSFIIEDGDRIAQIVFARVEEMRFVQDKINIAPSEGMRGVQGHGSTGVK